MVNGIKNRVSHYILNTPLTLRYGSEYLLLKGSDSLSATSKYPLFVNLTNGGKQPLFIGGIVTTAEIRAISCRVAQIIYQKFNKQKILLVQILEGARPFCQQIINNLHNYPDFRFETASLKVSSYNGSKAGTHKISKPLSTTAGELTNLAGFDQIIILDDLLDKGNTLLWLAQNYLANMQASNIQAFFMLEKQRKRTPAVNKAMEQCNAISGSLVPDSWLVGFGLDLNLPGSKNQNSLHLFRGELPGGIYAFNDAIEQELIKEYRVNPQKITEQLKNYISIN